jgi:flagellar assembly protein FliH
MNMMVRPFEFERRFDLEALPDLDQAAVLEQEQSDREDEERVLAEREAIASVARADGFSAGLEFARKEREAETLRVAGKLASALERSIAQAATIQGEITLDAIALAVAIGEGLAGELIKRAPLASAETTISKALAEQFERPRLIVKVAEKDRTALQEFIDRQVELVGYEGRMTVQADPDLAVGDCIVEWSDGGVRSILSERRERVIGQLVELLAANDPAEAGHGVEA